MTQTLSHHGIGASEIASIVGMNPFSSPWDVWLRKTGQAPEQESNPAMEWGHRLEPAIRQKYVDDTGSLVHVPTTSLFHAETAWARATPDGIIVREAFHGNPGVWPREFWTHLLQCKNVNYWVGKEWDVAPPVYVQLQELWEMHVTGLDRADIACLIGGSDFRVFTVHRDNKMIDDLVTIAAAFWRKVEARTPPVVDGSDACRAHFERRLATVKPVELVADSNIDETFETWRSHLKAIKHSTSEVERIRNEVRSHLADAQADRLVSRHGIAKLDVNKQLRAPREWSKETP